jgi:anhydro-N-acetylmuramic acid kinase
MAVKDKYKVVGVMSGTSLDGLDIACCTFVQLAKGWSFKIDHAQTIKYSGKWLNKLANAHVLSAPQLLELDSEYGKLVGKFVADFIVEKKFRPDFISSHGHTVFHQPDKGFTFQIGNGTAVYSVTGIPVVCDFRSLDVLLGGEGAPLVPAGDRYLFGEYEICLNLGGIANLSMEINRERIAFDICFNNMALNYLAAKTGKTFDRSGRLASEGQVNRSLLKRLDKVYSKFRKHRPSLGRELFEKHVQPLLDDENISISDRLATCNESAAIEIMRAIPTDKKIRRLLCTGGGAFNSYFISRLLDLSHDRVTLIVPEDDIIKFKEALIFAFLGILRVRDEINCLKSVTGADRNSSGGVLIGF